MAKQKKRWVFSPSSDPKTAITEATKNEVGRKAGELIETTLTMKYVEPPPKHPKFNYVIGLSTKWHGRYFYFVATYACLPRPGRDLADLRGQLRPVGTNRGGPLQPGVHAAHR